MAAKQDIAVTVEAHTISYMSVILSPTFTTPLSRATEMAAYYLPTTSSFADGSIISISDRENAISMIRSPLKKLSTDEGIDLEFRGHRTEVIGENSAIAWITMERRGVIWTNLYFFRRLESGEVGYEGGNFDGEMRAMRELAKA
jgi:hypothetical protein